MGPSLRDLYWYKMGSGFWVVLGFRQDNHVVIIAYNPAKVLITLLTKSHIGPP